MPEFLRFGCVDCGWGLSSELLATLATLDGRECFAAKYEAIKQFGEIIEFPSKLIEIEIVLMKRMEKNRNWLVGETLNDLLSENEEHNI